MANFNWLTFLMILTISSIFVTPINGIVTNQRKLLDDDTSIKCGCSSCTPCVTPSPPPPSPTLCPPPPAVVLPPPPPPPPKKPPTPSLNCPPPPWSQTPFSPLIYVPGPPGNLYPIDNDYSGSRKSVSGGSPVAVICGLVGLFMMF